jgi:RNA polymerase sigma factor (sigma-70 family)
MPSSDLDGESDADLVAWMTLRSEDERTAFLACEVLYRRHSPLLLGWCQQKAENIFGEAAEDFVNATFLKAFDHAETFAFPQGASSETQTRLLQGWLFRILKNLLKDSLKAEARERQFRDRTVNIADIGDDPDFDFPCNDDTDGEPSLSPRALLARDFLENEITEEDQDLLQLGAMFFDFVRNEPVIDPDLLQAICQKIGLTPSGLRSRRKRLSERLRTYIENHESESE